MSYIKNILIQRLEPVMSKIDNLGVDEQYVIVNSSFTNETTTDTFELSIELMVILNNHVRRGDYHSEVYAREPDRQWKTFQYCVVQEIYLYKDDGSDIKEFSITKQEIEKQINESYGYYS